MQVTNTDKMLDIPAAPEVSYQHIQLPAVLADGNVLAVFGFGESAPTAEDERYTRVALQPLDPVAPFEVWRVAQPVSTGVYRGLRWAEGGGWLLAALEADEAGGGPQAAAHRAYQDLTRFLRTRPAYRVQRLWNYLDAINVGEGDAERYKQFCAGRLSGMQSYFADGFPAATAIGHPVPCGHLQVYCLATTTVGTRIENPRQLSAWCYPREYGPVAPSFARAMRLPADDALAISGTAAIHGHQSRHEGDLDAQLTETLANLQSLLESAGMPAGLGPHTPLKIYLRHPSQAPIVHAFLDQHAAHAPRLLLHADICRSELLVEIDGWSFA